jgi:predicted O-methyltransferase YrrM
VISCYIFAVFLINGNPYDSVYEHLNYEDMQQKTGIDKADLMKIVTQLCELEGGAAQGWGRSYPFLSSLIQQFDFRIGCEVGVAFGTHSQHILENTSVKKLYSIDPYCHFPSNIYDDPMNWSQNNFDVLFCIVQKRLSFFEERSTLLRKTSYEALSCIEDGSLDFIYLDANHSYAAVKDDLKAWYKKIKKGGIFAGDDYGHVCFPGLKRAVDEFFSEKGLSISYVPEVNFYWVIKDN